MGTLRDLQFALQLKIEELRQRDTLIDELELELDTKDELIRRLQEELDRYRASVSLPGSSAASAACSVHGEDSQRANRKTVISEPFSLDPVTLAMVSQRICDKSKESQRLIQAAFSKNALLKNLDEGEVRAITACMCPSTINQGCYVVQEGAGGAQAYVLEEGRLDVTKDGLKLLTIEPEDMFGELSLLYNCTHTYSVSAQTDCKLWVIDRKSYQTILMQSGLNSLSHLMELLSSIPFLQSLPEDVIMKMSDLMEETHYNEGDYIIRQGATGDTFYILTKGQVNVTEKKAGHEEQIVLSKLSEREWFGEKALWGEDVRTLDVVAAGEVTCLVIDRETFKDSLGGLVFDCSHEVKQRHESKIESDKGPDLVSSSNLSDFQIVCPLAVGEFGHVDLVQLKSNIKCLYAMRVLKKKLILNNGQREHILREGRILLEAHCPFIARLHKTFRDTECLYILTEACLGGDLCNPLKDKGCLDDCSARLPFSDADPLNILTATIRGIDQIDFPKTISKSASSLIKKLCRSNPSERLGSQRNGAKDIQKHKWFEGFNWDGLCKGTLSPPVIPKTKDPVDSSASFLGQGEAFPSIALITAEALWATGVKAGSTMVPVWASTIARMNGSEGGERWTQGAHQLRARSSRCKGRKAALKRRGEGGGGIALYHYSLPVWALREKVVRFLAGDQGPPPHPISPAAPRYCTHPDSLYLLPAMHFQEWLRSLRPSAGLKGSDSEDFWSLLPSFPRSSLSLSQSSLLGLGALASLTAYWLVTRPRPMRPPCDLQAQSVAINGDPSCRRSALLKDDTLLEFYYDDTRTAFDMFQRGVRIAGDGPCLGFRKPGQPYEWISYSEVAQRAQVLGSGLLAKGCQPNPEQFVGIFAQNRPEWIISELACYTYSMAVVPLYDTLGLEAMVHILNLAEISLVICDREEKATELLENKETGVTPKLSCLVLFNEFSDAFVERAKNCEVEVLKLEQLMDLGRQNLKDPVPPQPQDLAVVCFTSGTTGKPKGAMITHGNIASNTSSVIKILEGSFVIRQEDVSISYLPLAHMFERMIQVSMFCHGARVGFYQGDISLLMDDIKTLKPTFFPVVPRLLNRIYDKILGSVTSPLRRALLHYAVRRKQAELSSGVVRNNSLWDRLVFNRIQANLGGNLRFALTASAPISPAVLSFLRATMGCLIFEGYGQTECTAGCTFSMPGDWSAGHVGAPLPCAKVKLVDIPDMNYYAKNGDGEICISGPSVFRGYLKDPEKTAEALDSDGWLHSGDVGQWLPNGTLRIIDRKKHIFKLSQGEYIAPEKIENVYMRCVPVLQVFVHGDSLQSYLIGIAVPDPEVFVNWAKERGYVGSYEELCQNPDLTSAILEDMKVVGKEAGLKSFEQVKDLYLHPEMFSVANGLLTPTMKSRRIDIRKYFQEQLTNMYSKTAV
ncbi:Long-chain-fatty-acid--CoA ligase 1 [Dissostichus eleginoides]|uniref:Long-chain-fatty-acid--CoA ligase n=1 Tax=Dissostichus eleginoides TaxID=100907 RepID=A0AAD9BYR7_DISEL|nr:Long-chain-fatty-acid--CoA ligase 1 [Dissostichus eleginoides]